ncbi:hypothetical protein ACIBH1_15225 [Nonomuraea sp. NPDC050663]|uniref:hypothetical protein n=1 Tax=Nonomuraea sp. NPDC050663 TaxID=3364370 RepID=UPI0037A5EBD2
MTQRGVTRVERVEAGRGLAATLIALTVISASAAVAQSHASVVPSWLKRARSSFELIWPQRWSFFSREGTAPFTVAYSLEGGRFRPIVNRQASAELWWGIRRSGTEFSVRALGASIPNRYWYVCTADDIGYCRSVVAAVEPFEFLVPAGSSLPCGRSVFARKRPSGDGLRVHQIAVVKLSCPR